MEDKDLTETKAQGYKVENGKLVYFSNMLDGYKHEYKDLKEICEEMNGLLKRFNSYEEQLSFWKYKAEEKFPKDSVVLSREEYEKLKYTWITDSDAYKKGCKETAEKIYTKIKDSFLMNSNNRYALKLWIEEQFGLEIKE